MPNNIGGFNDYRAVEYQQIIVDVLTSASRKKMKFSKAQHLQKYVEEQTGIHRTTLKRNNTYWALIRAYVREQPGAASFVEDAIDVGVVEASLLIAQAKIGRLERELRASQKQLAIAQSEERQVALGPPGAVKSNELKALEVALNDTCALLASVLVRAEVYAIDMEARVLFDKTERPGSERRPVSTPQRAAAFLQWVELNHMLPYVQSVPKGSSRA